MFLPQGQPLGKALFKFGHGPAGAQGIGPDFVDHGFFLSVTGDSGASVWRAEGDRRGVYQRACRGSRRGSRGLASLTVRVRPAIAWPWSLAIAVLAAVPSCLSAKPKPLERPVSRSVITRISSTTPYGSKSWRTSCSVAPNARLPTKIFMGSSLWEREQVFAQDSENVELKIAY